MKRREYLYDHYLTGLFCLIVVCVLPLVSPILIFINQTVSYLPYVLILVSILGVLYEFFPREEELVKRIKVESVLIMVSCVLFFLYDLIILIVQAEHLSQFNWISYSLLGYALIPIITVIIEIIFSLCKYFKNENKPESNTNNRKIAKGNTINV